MSGPHCVVAPLGGEPRSCNSPLDTLGRLSLRPQRILHQSYEVRLHAGNLFGERALLKNEPRAASVTCVTEVPRAV